MSTSTSTLIPARSGGGFLSLVSMRTRIGIALDDLDPVAAGVLRRQQRKFLRRGRAHAFDDAVPFQVRISIDGDGGRLAGPNVGQLGLLRRRIDPHMIGVDQEEGRRGCGQIFAGRDRRHTGDGAGERRLYDGMIELPLRFVDLRLGLRYCGCSVVGRSPDRRRAWRAAPGPAVRSDSSLLLSVASAYGPGRISACETVAVRSKRRVAIVVDLIEIDLRLLGGDVAQHALIILLHRLDRQRGLRQIGLGVVERDLELTRIEPIKNLAGLDVLVVRDGDLLHDSGHVGRRCRPVGLDVGVVRRHHPAAGDVRISRHKQHERQEREQHPAHTIAAAHAQRRVGRRSAFLERSSTGAICGARAVSAASPRSTGGTGAICGFRVVSYASPRSLGTTLRSGSGIAAFSRNRAGMALLDQPPQVFLHERKLRNHFLDALPASMPASVLVMVSSPEFGEPLEQRPCRRREKQAFRPAVAGIGPALDQAAVAKLVEEACERNRLQVEHVGEFGLVQALGTLQPYQHGPLRPGDAELRRLVVGIGPQQTGYIIENEAEFAIDGVLGHAPPTVKMNGGYLQRVI